MKIKHKNKLKKIKGLINSKGLKLICPGKCKHELIFVGKKLKCTNQNCIHSNNKFFFKIEDQIPIIISEENCDTLCNVDTKLYVNRSKHSEVLRNIIYGQNKITLENCRKFVDLIKGKFNDPNILIIGSGEVGNGTDPLWKDKSITKVGVDIYKSENVDVVCDGHYLPFERSNFHGVWIQAVLEHVVDPNLVVSEIYRVLKKNGVVYAETPFMQQVHEGKYDFTRYTILGHRYLFKKFEVIDIGATKGAEVVLAWSLKYFFWSVIRNRLLATMLGILFHLILRPFSSITSKTSKYDSNSGSFFLGKKSNFNVTHKELLKLYKGNF